MSNSSKKTIKKLVKNVQLGKKWDFNVHKANLDFMYLLVHLPEFREQVLLIRETHGVPPKGFTDTQEGIEEGNKWLMNLVERDLFDSWAADIHALHLRVKGIRKDKRYFEHLRLYILYSRVTAPATNFEISRPYVDGKAGELNMVMYGPLTQKEIEICHQLVEIIRTAKEGPSKRYAPKKNTKRDLQILEKADKRGTKVSWGDEEYHYSTKDIVAEVFDESDIEGDRKNAEIARKALLRVRAELKERLGWDSE